MNTREQARFDMIKRVGDFGTNNATDFTTPVPPATAVTAGQTQAKQLFDALNTANTGLIALISKNAESQQTGIGTFHGGTTSKTVLRDALLLELKTINRTAAAIAESQHKPDIMDNFRMPHGVSDTTLVAKANAIADAGVPMQTDFVAHGHEKTFANDLRAHITTFEQAGTTQNTGQQSQAGATAGFEPLIVDAMTKVKQLDAFMHNFYKSNAEKLGEWKTASHVERQSKAKKAVGTPSGGKLKTEPATKTTLTGSPTEGLASA
jgi:hypothetical protein